jgi:glycerophosphoryl diester phosphodiesterase
MKRLLASLFLTTVLMTPSSAQGQLRNLREPQADEHIFVAAHRADWIYAPENSLQGLRNAIFFGADLIETDVRRTRDGHYIMMHDATVDRTTNGSGTIANMTLDEIRQLRLKTNWGQSTPFTVPTLDDFINEAKGHAYLYLDKAGIDLPGNSEGTTVRELLDILRRHDALQEAVFVLNWPYEKARRIFGTALDSVVYCPVIEDRIPNLTDYVETFLRELHPAAFQFRMESLDTESYRLLPHVLASGSRAFVASTWPRHTAGHDDEASIFRSPAEGWGWLVGQGFTIIETNYPKDLIQFLRNRSAE